MIAKCQIIFVYVLKLSAGKHYTGITNNLVKRLQQHYKHQSNYTSHFQVISLINLEVRESYQSARKLEVKIKQTGAIKYINKNKFKDRYFLDVPIKDVITLSNKIKPLNQLKIINEKKTNLNTYL